MSELKKLAEVSGRGDTPAMQRILTAARRGVNDKLLRLLLDHGADPSLETADKKTALDLAQEAKKMRVVEFLSGTD